MRGVIILFLLLLGACASQPQQQVRHYWKPDPVTWQAAATKGINLRSPDGAVVRYLPAATVSNLLTVKARLEPVSGVHADLAVVDSDAPNAYSYQQPGVAVVAFTLPWLDQLGRDPDAVASTLGHELAHLRLGHSGAARQQREDSAQGIATVVGTALNAAGIPLGSMATTLAATGVSRAFTRDEERAADEMGLRWAVAAGYGACGRQRVMAMYRRASPSLDLPFLSTHPGYAERSESASQVSVALTGRPC